MEIFTVFKIRGVNNFYNIKNLAPFFNRKNDSWEFDTITGSRLIELEMPDSLSLKNQNSFNKDSLVVNESSVYYANKILTLCKENNVKCTLFKVPMYSSFYGKFCSSIMSEQFLVKFSEEHGCRFIDFQKLGLSANKDCFKDYTHLNKNGAGLFSVFLADSIATQ